MTRVVVTVPPSPVATLMVRLVGAMVSSSPSARWRTPCARAATLDCGSYFVDIAIP